jgi:hypothetical protein
MTHVLVKVKNGTNVFVHVGAEEDLKALHPLVKWRDCGYKQYAHLNEITMLELFEVSS